ncbi:hypothetical protein ACFQ60_17815 [Streptomyces zhihengii]
MGNGGVGRWAPGWGLPGCTAPSFSIPVIPVEGGTRRSGVRWNWWNRFSGGGAIHGHQRVEAEIGREVVGDVLAAGRFEDADGDARAVDGGGNSGRVLVPGLVAIGDDDHLGSAAEELGVLVGPLPGTTDVARGHGADRRKVVDVLLAFDDEDGSAGLRLTDHLGEPVEDAADALDARGAVGPVLPERLSFAVVSGLQALHGEEHLAVLVDVRVLGNDLRPHVLLQGFIEQVGHGEAEGGYHVFGGASGVAVDDHALVAVRHGQGRGAVFVGDALPGRTAAPAAVCLECVGDAAERAHAASSVMGSSQYPRWGLVLPQCAERCPYEGRRASPPPWRWVRRQ